MGEPKERIIMQPSTTQKWAGHLVVSFAIYCTMRVLVSDDKSLTEQQKHWISLGVASVVGPIIHSQLDYPVAKTIVRFQK